MHGPRVLAPRLQQELKPKPRWVHKPGSQAPENRPKDSPEDEVHRAIVCARCAHPITSAAERIEVQGLHEHSQINSHGYIWNFGCFASAPGCASEGQPSTEFAWFPGTSWQIQICRGCSLHLGWRFDGAQTFYGLILERIVEVQS